MRNDKILMYIKEATCKTFYAWATFLPIRAMKLARLDLQDFIGFIIDENNSYNGPENAKNSYSVL